MHLVLPENGLGQQKNDPEGEYDSSKHALATILFAKAHHVLPPH